MKPKFKICEKCKQFESIEHADGNQYLYCDWQIMAVRPISLEWNPEAEDGLSENKYSRMQRTEGFVIPVNCPFVLEHTIK